MEGAAPRYVGIAVSRETSAQAAVEEALRAIDPDSLTPRAALDELYRLRGMVVR